MARAGADYGVLIVELSERWGQTPATDAVGTPIANLLVC